MTEFPDCCEKMKRLKRLTELSEEQKNITALLMLQDLMENHKCKSM